MSLAPEVPPEIQRLCEEAIARFGVRALDPYRFDDGVRTEIDATIIAEQIMERCGRDGWIAGRAILERLSSGRLA